MAHFALYVHGIHEIEHDEIANHLCSALAEAKLRIEKIGDSGDLRDLGYFQNITDDAGEVVGSFAIKHPDGSVWRPKCPADGGAPCGGYCGECP